MRIPIIWPLPLSMVFLQFLSPVQAQEAPPMHLPPVVIEGPRIVPELIPERLRNETEARDLLQHTPGGVSLVGVQEIRESRGANLKDVLDFVPGVLIRPRFGAADESQLSIRGSGLRNNFHLRGVHILLDGFAYGNADGFSDFESLELLSTKRIEVYKGGNALRFGANTLGGAINLVTKTGYDASTLELWSEVGSFSFFKNHIATGHVIGPFDLYVGFTDTELNGFRDHSACCCQTSPLLGHGNRLTVGVQFAGTWQSDRNFANVQGQRGALTKDQRNEAINVGAYLEEQFDLARALTLVLGGRVDYVWRSVSDRFFTDGPDDLNPDDSDSVDFVSASPKLGFVWQVTPTVQFFGNASRSSEPPLLLELTAPGQLQGDLSQLKAQKAWQFEVGTRGSWKEWLSWDVAAYNIELWDEIRNVNVQPFPGAPFTIPRFENIERSRHTGVEVGSEVRLVKNLAPRLGLGQMGDTLALRMAYTWSRFVFVDDATFDHNDLPGAPEHFVRGELRYRHQAGFWVAPNVEAVPTGYFVNSENTERTDPYTLVNFRLGYDYQPWKLSVFFEGRNLTDEVYASAVQVDSATGRFFEPGDGRAFYGGVSWQWR